MLNGRSPARMIVAVILLMVLYTVCYRDGIVQQFTAAIGVNDPGPIHSPDGLHNADLSELFSAAGGTDVSQAAKDSLATLRRLPLAGRASMSNYDRDQFGPAWSDVDHNGCDTRNDILRRDLTGVTFEPDTHDCVVTTGTLADPYTATTITFVRGQDTSGTVQIDYVVSLGDAWVTGAQSLSPDRRLQLANDPNNLLAVDGPSNEAKGDSDAADWLPPNVATRCRYVAMQVQVKATYGLWVTAPEKAAMTDVLEGC